MSINSNNTAVGVVVAARENSYFSLKKSLDASDNLLSIPQGKNAKTFIIIIVDGQKIR